jgi:hypothetical protein
MDQCLYDVREYGTVGDSVHKDATGQAIRAWRYRG